MVLVPSEFDPCVVNFKWQIFAWATQSRREMGELITQSEIAIAETVALISKIDRVHSGINNSPEQGARSPWG